MVKKAEDSISPYYVKNAEDDTSSVTKTMQIDLVLAANDVFKTHQDLSDAMMKKMLPEGYSEAQMETAMAAMKFLKDADLSADDTTAIYEAFTTEFVAANM